ncbi:mannitol-1-phosphate 5-dehydrogenase [Ruoffia tabacinasalis]|uniref:Mannitol-1-phosphate 5-dehydrogenase n=1 Tax=Ruoffia tabacinasalis TaxID=87458 RepID=A0ABS0LHD2_9LACT|nr:mannitol-1-phosphate 5-dehydrogenase [Ruoffia tabacinasalis]MBG9977687.1 mannitol-1-phosphate 5-dehydrogenase [Ruoffia tabacinasalis]
MKAVHFGAGNIGRGFIGEILSKNGFHIDFVDINESIINALKESKEYDIAYAAKDGETIHIDNVDGLNNGTEPEAVVEAIASANLVTTAIGPNVLPYIAELIAQGIQARQAANITEGIDIIACENMIGGSDFLREKVETFLTEDNSAYVEKYVGFPNAAVDRIVPDQHHEDPLFVSVEPFREWVIDTTASKATDIRLEGVHYVEDLEPFIERKLFSVNTGHATVAYAGAFYGYKTIDEAISDERILNLLQNVLKETGALLINKWNFDAKEHKAYAQKIVGRFENPHISDDVTRVARTPIRKLGPNERFIRPIREAKERDLEYQNLIDVVGMIFHYDNPEDKESEHLQAMLKEQSIEQVARTVTEIDDEIILNRIVAAEANLSK